MNVAQAVTIALAIGRARAQKVVGDRAHDTADRRDGRRVTSIFMCRIELTGLVFLRRARAGAARIAAGIAAQVTGGIVLTVGQADTTCSL